MEYISTRQWSWEALTGSPHLILAHDHLSEDGLLKAFGVKGWVAHQHDEQHAPKTPYIRLQAMGTASHHFRTDKDCVQKNK